MEKKMVDDCIENSMGDFSSGGKENSDSNRNILDDYVIITVRDGFLLSSTGEIDFPSYLELGSDQDKILDDFEIIAEEDCLLTPKETSLPGHAKILKALREWFPVRNESIEKLEKLLINALHKEGFFDNLQLYCKYGSARSKHAKIIASTGIVELVGALGSLFCDMASVCISAAHMYNTDSILSMFKLIMDMDAVASKRMYEERAKYLKEYQGTEEVIREFGGATVGETLGKISKAVVTPQFYHRMKKANKNKEDTAKALTSIVGCEVIDRVQDLVNCNPACVETIVGIGRTLYGAADCHMIPIKNLVLAGGLMKNATKSVDTALVTQDEVNICRLNRKIQGGSQSSVIRKIQAALCMFIQEKEEMIELFQSCKE